MKNIKILSLALAGITLLSAVPVNAYELEDGYSKELIEYQNSEDESFSNETSVFAELKSEYKVTIPKYIVLSGTSKTANYYVKAIGDIAGYERLEVVPDETVSLYSKNKNMQIASISQDKTTWHYDDFDTDANGIINANTITAGKWSGTFNFNINLIDGISEVKVLSDIILPPDEWNGQEAMGVAELETSNVMSLDTALSQSMDESLINDVVVTSSDENIVKVDGHKLIPVKDGEAKITTSLNGKSQSFKVRVTSEPTVRQCKHAPNFSTKENITYGEATGSYDTVTYCRYCGIEMSRETTNYKLKIVGLDTNRNEYDIEQLNIYPGRKQSFRLKLNDTNNAVARWQSTLKDGISITDSGQDCTMTISDNVPADTEFDLIATYMNATTTKLHIKILDENYIDETGFVDSYVPMTRGYTDSTFNGQIFTKGNTIHVFRRNIYDTPKYFEHLTYDGKEWKNLGQIDLYKNNEYGMHDIQFFEINNTLYSLHNNEISKAKDSTYAEWEKVDTSNAKYIGNKCVVYNNIAYIFNTYDPYKNDYELPYRTFDGQTLSDMKKISVTYRASVATACIYKDKVYMMMSQGNASSNYLLCAFDGTKIEKLCVLPFSEYSGQWNMTVCNDCLYFAGRGTQQKMYKYDGKEITEIAQHPDGTSSEFITSIYGKVYTLCNTNPFVIKIYNQFYRYNEQENVWTRARQKP